MIAIARNPRDIARERGMQAPRDDEGAFKRGWFHGARSQEALSQMPAAYYAGMLAGRSWGKFHGPERTPNSTHAHNAWELYCGG